MGCGGSKEAAADAAPAPAAPPPPPRPVSEPPVPSAEELARRAEAAAAAQAAAEVAAAAAAAAAAAEAAAAAAASNAGGGHDGGSHRVSGHANGQSSAGRVSSAQVCHSSASCVLGVDCWCRGQNWPSSHPLPPHRAAPVHPIWVVLWPFDLHLRGCAARDALLVWPWDGCWGVGFPLRRDSLACACLPLPRRRVTAPATAPWAPCLRPTASAARRLGVSCISRLTRWPSAPGAWPRA